MKPQPVEESTSKKANTKLPDYYVDILNSCGKNALSSGGDVESTQFIPLPDVRPKAKNPLTIVFHDSGDSNSEISLSVILLAVGGSLLLDILFSLLFFVISQSFDYLQVFHLIVILTVFVVIPQSIFSFLFMNFGEEGMLPICDCKEIREAYKESIKDLPEDILTDENPFQTTNVFIRKLKHFRQWIIWSYIAAFILQILLLFVYYPFRDWMLKRINDSYFIAVWIFPGLLAVISAFMLTCEKDFDDNDDEDGLFGCFLSSIFFWAYKDSDCAKILGEFKEDDD